MASITGERLAVLALLALSCSEPGRKVKNTVDRETATPSLAIIEVGSVSPENPGLISASVGRVDDVSIEVSSADKLLLDFELVDDQLYVPLELDDFLDQGDWIGEASFEIKLKATWPDGSLIVRRATVPVRCGDDPLWGTCDGACVLMNTPEQCGACESVFEEEGGCAVCAVGQCTDGKPELGIIGDFVLTDDGPQGTFTRVDVYADIGVTACTKVYEARPNERGYEGGGYPSPDADRCQDCLWTAFPTFESVAVDGQGSAYVFCEQALGALWTLHQIGVDGEGQAVFYDGTRSRWYRPQDESTIWGSSSWDGTRLRFEFWALHPAVPFR